MVKSNKHILQQQRGNGSNPRQLRVGEEIRHALAAVFMRGECTAPGVEGVSITVSEVRMSPDLKNATAYVMPLGGLRKEETIDALARASSELRKLVTDKIVLKFSPRLHFRLDDSYEEAHRINNLMKNPVVAKDLGQDSDKDQ